MIIKNLHKAIFLQRLNRFVGEGLLEGKKILFHIGDTGRLGELLKANNKIIIQKLSPSPNRKYQYRLIASLNPNNNFVLTNSHLHSKLVENFLIENKLPFQKEVKIGESRIDFLINDNIWVEIKGCSLIEGDTGFFPDAPTKRGAKHIEELFQIIKNGGKAEIRFLPVDNITYFSPNTKTDPLFSEKFYQFIKYGGKVKFLKINFNFKKDKANIYLQSLPNVKII